ncbi:MAG TPA: outer membrane beta-barrel protein [Thermoanaerobaculia bacterium]|nr:outer membrane beta-barrel protein [Thermoanaerobaculia bacterium]
MKRASLVLIVMTLATSALAQSSELGILLGGSKRTFANGDAVASDKWKFSNSVREIWYGYHLEPDTVLKIKVGEITALLGDASGTAPDVGKGRIEHIDLLVDYRFDESFGSTGIFGGAGLYRQMSGPGRGTSDTNTDYGYSVGVNGDFPLSRRYGVIIEGAYHWVNYSYKPRFLTVTGGIRIKL